jgi:hypothetical protein
MTKITVDLLFNVVNPLIFNDDNNVELLYANTLLKMNIRLHLDLNI